MADYTERQLLEIAVTGTDQVEASAKAFLDEETASKRAQAEIYAFAESAKEAASKTYTLAGAVESASKKTAESAAAQRQQAAAAAEAAREVAHLGETLQAAARMERDATTATTQHVAAMGRASTTMAGSTNKYQQNITALGYSVNDFFSVTGGLDQRLNAIANNLPMLLAGFGGLGLALSGIVPIIAMVYKNWDVLNAALTGGGNKVPESTDAVKRLDEALKKVGESLGTLREKQSLTNFELMDYNKLSREQIALERQKNDEAERKRDLEAVTGIVGKERQERAAGFKEAVAEAGGGESATTDLASAIARLNQDMSSADIAKKADELMTEAGQGWKDAIEEIRKTVRAGQPDEKRQKLADEIQGRTPEAKKGKEIGEARQKAEEEQADEQAKAAMKAERETEHAVSAAASDTRHEFGEDLTAAAKDELVAGVDRDQVKATLKGKLKGKLSAVPEAIRDAVAEEVVDSIVKGVSVHEINRAVAAGETKAARETKAADLKAKKSEAVARKEKTDLEKAVGPEFMTAAAMRQMDMTAEVSRGEMTRAEKARQEAAMQANAHQRLVRAGMDKDKAGHLAGGFLGDVDANIRTGLGQVRAVPGMEGADTGQAMMALYQQLQMQQARMAAQPPRRAGTAATGHARRAPQRQLQRRPIPRRPNHGADGFQSVPAADPDAGLGQVAQGVQGVNGASLARDRAAQGAAGEMLQAMNVLAAAHAQNGQGWGQIAAAAKQIRNGIKRPGG